ncbi:MAG: class I SAM-dependent methyltransferase [Cognatishimia sp.]|nr:class I SAM-dependent methyltransferase [Cognatishimia sp.]NQY40215.1 class I SAM-dependent methyltransferase [Henriciella sp.]
MKKFGPGTFGKLHAETYDALHNPGTTDQAVSLLAELAGNGHTLELAIGTGRVALPLAEQGVDITGFDASPEMLEKLKQKPGGNRIPTSVADMASFDLEERFDFAFLIFNTIYNLTRQEDQVSCFQNVAKHLNPRGKFLVETFVPSKETFERHQAVRTKHVSFDQVWIEAVQHDPVTQNLAYQRIHITAEGVSLSPLPMRYIWPSEMDLMAELAGLKLINRWGGWQREPFTADSDMHVSVYQLQ